LGTTELALCVYSLKDVSFLLFRFRLAIGKRWAGKR
jgi:hypothetical protein